MYFSGQKHTYEFDWRIYIESGEGQSFLEIINLIKKHGARNLRWQKGIGFELDPYKNRSSQNTRSGKVTK